MDIKELEVRIYILAGQLEEAKRIYQAAQGEIERDNKEQANRSAETVTANSGQTVSVGEPAKV